MASATANISFILKILNLNGSDCLQKKILSKAKAFLSSTPACQRKIQGYDEVYENLYFDF